MNEFLSPSLGYMCKMTRKTKFKPMKSKAKFKPIVNDALKWKGKNILPVTELQNLSDRLFWEADQISFHLELIRRRPRVV